MKIIFALLSVTLVSLAAAFAAGFNISDYNQALPSWGTSWRPGADALNGYYPSFYTGFAMRSSFPDRIHVRLARGNQTRVSVILDEQTISDYLFDLAKRHEFYQAANAAQLIRPVSSEKASVTPQLQYFNQILEAEGILSFVDSAKRGNQSAETIYRKSLETLTALNPGRVFSLRINLQTEFLKWKSQMRALLANENDAQTFFSSKPDQAVIALNSLLWGRINLVDAPSKEMLTLLANTATLAKSDNNNEQFILSALALFQMTTGNKYKFRVLENGQWQNAIQCQNVNQCFLVYPEFTTIYPTGSVKSSTKDQFGNTIPTFATPGLWRFLSRGSRHDVDNIRDESYYGWAPKMDYEEIGNGFHNPAVRFAGIGSEVKSALGINETHSTLWSVMRGGVSHGCSRLSLGHVWEMRHIFPVENEKMTQVYFFGNNPQDFDVYDVDGNGSPEVMGVEYMISYNVKGSSGLARREGADLKISKEDKLNFYSDLYGAENVFTQDSSGNFIFHNPSASILSYLNFQKKKITTRLQVNGEIPLWEQAYERDKVQFYLPFTTQGLTTAGSSPLSKRIVRLLGRVRGCAPTTNKNLCGEAAFDAEAQKILAEIAQ